MKHMTEAELMKLARTRVVFKTVLKTLWAVYLAVNALLVGIWFFSGGGYFWPIWVMGGWGLGLIIVTIVFNAVAFSGFNDKVNAEYNKIKHNVIIKDVRETSPDDRRN